jgi:hypothetical protein
MALTKIKSTGIDTLAGDISLVDSAKINLGTGNDLQLYHSGSKSYIKDAGTGNLAILTSTLELNNAADSQNMVTANEGGGVYLYHAGSTKLGTTSTGVTITGTAVATAFTGNVTGNVTGNTSGTAATVTTAAQPAITSVGTLSSLAVGNITTTGYIRGPASFVIDPATHGDDTGTLVIAGNLQVDGTTTTINSTTVSVDDVQIILAQGASNSAAANGGGIILDGANASISYTHATTSWDFNKPIKSTSYIEAVGNISTGTDGGRLRAGGSNEMQLYFTGSHGILSSSTGNFTLDVAGSIKLDADSSNVYLSDGGTDIGLLSVNNQDLNIRNTIADKDIYFQGNDSDNGGNFTAFSLDMSQYGKATFNSGITAGASTAGDWGLTLNTLAGDNMKLSVQDTGSSGAAHGILSVSDGGFTIDVTGDINLDADGGDITLKDGGTEFGHLSNSSGLLIQSAASNSHIFLTPAGTGNVQINSDNLTVTGAEGESATLMLQADEADDNADIWGIRNNTDNTLTFINQISGSLVPQITLTPHATVANSTTAIAGALTVAGTTFLDGGNGYFRDGVGNSYSSGWDANTDDHSTWINFEGYQGGTTRFRDLRIGTGKQASFVHFDGSEAAVTILGNVGIGITPNSGWPTSTDFRVLQIGTGIGLWGRGSGDEERGGLTANLYHDGSAFKYLSTGVVTSYQQNDGTHRFSNAASGSANATATLIESLVIDSDRKVGIGINSGTVEGRVDVRMNMVGVDWTDGNWSEVWDASGTPGNKFDKSVFHIDTNRNGGATGGIVGIAFSPGWQGHQNWGIYSFNKIGGSSTEGDLAFVNQLNTSGIQERLRFKSDGKVGIGVSDPDAKLEIKGTGGSTGLTFKTTDASSNETFFIKDGGGVGVRYYPFSIGVPSSTSIVSGTRMFIDGTSTDITVASTGYLGIGTTGPNAPLDITPDSNKKTIRVDNISQRGYQEYVISGTIGANAVTITMQCGSYFQAEVVATFQQSNGGTDNNVYFNGIWTNNHTTHLFKNKTDGGTVPRIGSMGTNPTFSVGVGDSASNTGKLIFTKAAAANTTGTFCVHVRVYGYNNQGMTYVVS